MLCNHDEFECLIYNMVECVCWYDVSRVSSIRVSISCVTIEFECLIFNIEQMCLLFWCYQCMQHKHVHMPALCCSMSLCLMRCLMRHVPMKTSTSEQPDLLSVLFFKGNNYDIVSNNDSNKEDTIFVCLTA